MGAQPFSGRSGPSRHSGTYALTRRAPPAPLPQSPGSAHRTDSTAAGSARRSPRTPPDLPAHVPRGRQEELVLSARLPPRGRRSPTSPSPPSPRCPAPAPRRLPRPALTFAYQCGAAPPAPRPPRSAPLRSAPPAPHRDPAPPGRVPIRSQRAAGRRALTGSPWSLKVRRGAVRRCSRARRSPPLPLLSLPAPRGRFRPLLSAGPAPPLRSRGRNPHRGRCTRGSRRGSAGWRR